MFQFNYLSFDILVSFIILSAQNPDTEPFNIHHDARYSITISLTVGSQIVIHQESCSEEIIIHLDFVIEKIVVRMLGASFFLCMYSNSSINGNNSHLMLSNSIL